MEGVPRGWSTVETFQYTTYECRRTLFMLNHDKNDEFLVSVNSFIHV